MVKRALWSTAGMVVVFTAFAVVTTQVKTVRAGSPWQDDPYDGVVSFTVFLVPALAFLVAARVTLTRNRVMEPVYRASLVALALVAATAVTDWIAVALRADRPLWNGWTPWLIGALAVVTGVTAAVLPVVWQARRRVADAESPGDWLTDLPVPAKAFIRRHIVAIAALASLAGGLAITTAEAVGEGWTSPLLYLTGAAIGAGGFFAFSMATNALLHLAVPPAKRRSRVHRAFRFAVVLGAAALPVAAVLRDEIWPPVDSPERFAAVTFGGGLVVFAVTLVAGYLAGPGLSPRGGTSL